MLLESSRSQGKFISEKLARHSIGELICQCCEGSGGLVMSSASDRGRAARPSLRRLPPQILSYGGERRDAGGRGGGGKGKDE